MCLFRASSVLESNALLGLRPVSLSAPGAMRVKYLFAEAIDSSPGATMPGLILHGRRFREVSHRVSQNAELGVPAPS
jgi:hypothetical protein